MPESDKNRQKVLCDAWRSVTRLRVYALVKPRGGGDIPRYSYAEGGGVLHRGERPTAIWLWAVRLLLAVVSGNSNAQGVRVEVLLEYRIHLFGIQFFQGFVYLSRPCKTAVLV